MQPPTLFALFLLALRSTTTLALPLNINLGAYSPALVVGDGAISFEESGSGDGSEVENIVDALQGASASSSSPPVHQVAPAPSNEQQKRDLAGFDRALNFAEAALTKGPHVELGTGAEGSGVGLTVDNNAAGETENNAGETDIVIVAPAPVAPAKE
ncbi:hypothetical protein QBC35DRAFT_545798 [Podospora australis]|uniref:Uncharacterized protein n=1 Tax=Podospora australis TaxID=1536484 RepID=A0AAN6WWB5_9PEZI|nr:hypothetical protein QBC35DRAFT_545798 [Podospora australis]